MIRYVTPHLYLESVLDLDPAQLRERGIDGLLLDVDCTLKDHRVNCFSEPVVAWVKKLQAAGMKLCIVSNGLPHRIGPLAEMLGVPFVAQALKPLPRGCRAALEKLDLPAERVAVVGDQLFADILAGRLAGLYTILVRPTTPDEPWFTRLKRPLERRLLRNRTPLTTR